MRAGLVKQQQRRQQLHPLVWCGCCKVLGESLRPYPSSTSCRAIPASVKKYRSAGVMELSRYASYLYMQDSVTLTLRDSVAACSTAVQRARLKLVQRGVAACCQDFSLCFHNAPAAPGQRRRKAIAANGPQQNAAVTTIR